VVATNSPLPMGCTVSSRRVETFVNAKDVALFLQSIHFSQNCAPETPCQIRHKWLGRQVKLCAACDDSRFVSCCQRRHPTRLNVRRA
jgi:hypothetical protein